MAATSTPLVNIIINGTFSASGFSSTFTPYANDKFSVNADFPPGAAGSVTIERSYDGGGTWAAIMAGSRVISILTTSGTITFLEKKAGALYRLNASVSAGSIGYAVSPGDNQSVEAPLYSGTFQNPGGIAADTSDTFGDLVFGTTFVGTDASVTVTRSTDGGATWATFQAARTTNFSLLIAQGSPPARYRFECTMTTGKVPYNVVGGFHRQITTMGPDPINPYAGALTMSPAQIQQMNALRWTPVADADLAGDLTIYKSCAGNTFAKLTVPAAAQRTRGPLFLLGANREIRAEYVDVVSVFDGNGNAIGSAQSQTDPSTTYQAGTRVTSRDVYGVWTGNPKFTSSRYPVGIYGYLSLLEAATGHLAVTDPMPNLSALGL